MGYARLAADVYFKRFLSHFSLKASRGPHSWEADYELRQLKCNLAA